MEPTGWKLRHQEIQMCAIKYFRKNLSFYEYFPTKIIKLKTKRHTKSLDNNWNKEIIKIQAAPVCKILEN